MGYIIVLTESSIRCHAAVLWCMTCINLYPSSAAPPTITTPVLVCLLSAVYCFLYKDQQQTANEPLCTDTLPPVWQKW